MSGLSEKTTVASKMVARSHSVLRGWDSHLGGTGAEEPRMGIQ